MKKLFAVIAVAGSLALASCGTGDSTANVADSTKIADSVKAVTDSLNAVKVADSSKAAQIADSIKAAAGKAAAAVKSAVKPVK